jgi:hypothetical protein
MLKRNLLKDDDAMPLPKEKKFCDKWSLEEAVAKILDIKFQDSKEFPKLISELYAYSFECCQKNNSLFNFLETRFNANLIQDKEVHLHFDVVNSREEAQK